MSILPFLVVMGCLLALSAFFSSAETALFSLTAGQVHQLAISRRRLGRQVARLLKDPESLLITLLIGNMVVNVVYLTLASVATLLLKRDASLHTWQISIWAVGALVVLVLIGEVAPKVLAYSYNLRLAPLVTLPLFLVHQALRPVQRLLRSTLVRPLTRLARPADHVGRVSVDELRSLLKVSERRGVLHADETLMLHEILGLSQIKVRDVMVPRVQMAAFDVARPAGELHDLFRSTGRSKLPVYRRDLDHILGWADARQVFLHEASKLDTSPLPAHPDRPLTDVLTPVSYTPELATVEQLLQEFRRARVSRAIVVDEYGGTAGLVTLQDVVEEIVGDIQDAQAPAHRPLVQQVGALEYSVSGQLPIHDWAEAFGHELDDPRLITVGGLVGKLLGRLPRPGDRVQYGNVTFSVESMAGRRIERLRLTIQAALPAEGGADDGGQARAEARP